MSEKITVVAYSPLKCRALRQANNLLEELGSKYRKTKVQVILNFLTSKENVVAIPKAESVAHVRENCGASGWRLSKDDLNLISEEF